MERRCLMLWMFILLSAHCTYDMFTHTHTHTHTHTQTNKHTHTNKHAHTQTNTHTLENSHYWFYMCTYTRRLVTTDSTCALIQGDFLLLILHVHLYKETYHYWFYMCTYTRRLLTTDYTCALIQWDFSLLILHVPTQLCCIVGYIKSISWMLKLWSTYSLRLSVMVWNRKSKMGWEITQVRFLQIRS